MTTPIKFADLAPVILAGGSGTRLWPISRAQQPKHLAKLIGNQSLLQQTVARVKGFAESNRVLIVGAENQSELTAQQVCGEIDDLPSQCIYEPSARNTAAAVGMAAHQSLKLYGSDCLIFVCPSDHLILSPEILHTAIEKGIQAARGGKIVTFGIQPSRPETGFGYIQIGGASNTFPGVNDVDKFVEKPDLETAQSMLDGGKHLWNSGMFLMRASVILEELELFEKSLADHLEEAYRQRGPKGEISNELYSKIKSIPIDKAVMERSSKMAVVPCDPNWSDLGSWHALWEVMPKDPNGNATEGDVLIEQGSNNIVKSTKRLVALAGVSNLAVIETEDAILIADREKSELVKIIVTALTEKDRIEAIQFPSN